MRIAAIAPLLIFLASPIFAESTKTLRLELPADGFVVENLCGTVKVTGGGTGKVEVVATLHAEDEAALSRAGFDESAIASGGRRLRVRPSSTDIRCGGAATGFFSGSTTYGGKRYRVRRDSGELFSADLEIRIPAGARGTIADSYGSVDGSALDGRIRFDLGSAGVRVAGAKGWLEIDGGSGDAMLREVDADLSVDLGSGDCRIDGLRGSRAAIDVGSGNVTLAAASPGDLAIDTGSGDVRIEGDSPRVVVSTGSGNVTLDEGGRLRTVKVETGSGDVEIGLPAAAGFHAAADQGSGSLHCSFPDATSRRDDGKIVGWSRGDGRVRIDVDTGSGDVLLRPVAERSAAR